MKTHLQFIVSTLQNARGDDSYRARLRFQGFTPRQMDQEFGTSGKTPNEILLEYKAHEDRVDSAIAWVKALAGEGEIKHG